MPTTTSRLPAVAAVLATLALAACGGSDDGGSASTSSSSSTANAAENDQDAARVRLRECLRENGVDLPDRVEGSGPPPGELDAEAIQDALNGPCKEEQQAAFGSFSDDERQDFEDRFQRFAQCMRENGVEIPDITSDEPAAVTIDPDDPDVQRAREACEDVAPQGGLRLGGEG